MAVMRAAVAWESHSVSLWKRHSCASGYRQPLGAFGGFVLMQL
jgi:hypothetical protein